MAHRHIVLAGDSIFDNDGYVLGEPGVIEQMRKSIPHGWSSSKIAVDGDRIIHIQDQIRNLPSNATDLIVSVGGNDARFHSGLLSKIQSPKDLDQYIQQPVTDFRTAYQQMLDKLINTGLRLHVCTIYTAIPFEDLTWRQYVPLAIGKFNEVITEEAGKLGVSVLNLDEVCTQDSDFSSVSPIEPSAQGGQKIVNYIIENLQ